MPPAAIRRPLTITTWLLISGLALALSPLLLALAAIAGRVTGRRQPLLLARLVIAYFARELGVLVACGILWLASGFGIRMGSRRFESLHHTLLGWFVHGLVERARTLFEIEVVLEPSDEAAQALQGDRPLLLFSRHAGPGDTALLVDLLITRYDRRPSIVFKHTLAIDPCVDLIGHRLPHAILDTSEPEECEARIEQVAAELEPRGVLLLFPEGGNFTKERRRKALRRLWRKGRRRDAAEARKMSNVLPPHPGGVLAALRGNPDADVVFAAHTGLGLAAFPRELWRRAPIGATLTERMWLEPAARHPDDPEEQVEWLNGWWKRLDAWIEEQPDDRVAES
jgi:1-acyl-sn-glycerol-3-phosphate acyltransferase